MVGQAALVNLLPAVAQLAQLVLHFSATHGGDFVGIEQGFGLSDQVGAHLIGQPALPAFGIAACRQSFVQALVQTGVQLLAMGLEQVAQSHDSFSRRCTFAFGQLLFQHLQSLGHSQHGLLTQGLALGGVDFGFDRFFGLICFGRFGRFCGSNDLWREFASQAADLVGPHGHWGQSGCGVGLGQRSQSRCG